MEATELYSIFEGNGFRFSTDTRTISPGDIYIGIKGDVFDGNTFAQQALEKGALYAVIDNPEYHENNQCILVSNTRKILEELALIHRSKFSIPIVVIGGSNGKTTTKELVHAVLSKKYKTHTTKGNLNNDLGVPLTLLAMPVETEIAIIEIGANHPREHLDLMDIVQPTHVLVTNNGADHLEGFGSLEGVRNANKEIYDWVKQHDGYVFVNKDLQDLVENSENIARNLYPSKKYESASDMYAKVIYDGVLFSSSLFGSYNEANILAAIEIGGYFSVPRESIQDAIVAYKPTLKRSQIVQGENYSLVLDCYNANPSSMEFALRDFVKDTSPGKRIILIGDMLEMGTEETRVHREILELVKILVNQHDLVLCVGPRFGAYKTDFPFTFFENADAARSYFNTLNLEDTYIFVKASRGIKLEEVIKEKIPLS